MNINRHNYEEFFILYMDNELNGAERRMVEAFVQNNPDLKDELDILLQSKLVPDHTVVFDSKDELMKIAGDPVVDLTNYEEWLILYVDNELSSDQKKQVEVFLALHPQIQNELSILQKSKLQPEEIVFPDKESLYRKTEGVRVIPVRWRRVAAAILLLALSTTAIFVVNKKKQTGESFASETLNNQLKSINRNIAPSFKENNVNPEAQAKGDGKDQKQNNSILPNLARTIERKSPENKNDTREERLIANTTDNQPSNNLANPSDNPYLKNHPVETEIATTTSQIENTISQTNNGRVTIQDNPSSLLNKLAAKNPDATPASLEEGDNKGSRGFFRKAVRFFEKTTGIKPANDDNKVLIGGLAVKL